MQRDGDAVNDDVGGAGGPRERVVGRVGGVCGVWCRHIAVTQPRRVSVVGVLITEDVVNGEVGKFGSTVEHVKRTGKFVGIRADEAKTERSCRMRQRGRRGPT